jgi:radical SAM superfamily enzyme with C-terminal helix-hairpin-helix motif
MENKVLIVDGYIDTPSCLGVPPYLSPLARYVFGAIHLSTEIIPQYITIDHFRNNIKKIKSNIFPKNRNASDNKAQLQKIFLKSLNEYFQEYWIVIFISGVSVPGKYLSGKPITFSELKRYSKYFPNALKILCGPATMYGIGEEGGKSSKSISHLMKNFNLIIQGDVEIALYQDFNNLIEKSKANYSENGLLLFYNREEINDITNIAIEGAKILKQHTNFRESDGGNVICEIETFRGCPRYISGGCSFCIEPSKGKTKHRSIDGIVKEIKSLYALGGRHFRLGNQSDFYAFHHIAIENRKYPKPNPEMIEKLLQQIRSACPEIKTLHIDNVNPLNFTLYPKEAKKITELIVQYCTDGNIAAFGVESLDPIVIKKNNLKVSKEELLQAIEMVNAIGSSIGNNGVSKFLPGLNFIMGLPGETKETLNQNFAFLEDLLNQNLLIRRINLRKLLVSSDKSNQFHQKTKKHLKKFQSEYYHWRKEIREKIDNPMLQKVFPYGRVLRNVYCEKHQGKNTLLRQIGTYPIICFVPRIMKLYEFFDLIVIDHGYRSITCLQYPVSLTNLSLKELESIPGIGKKIAQRIIFNSPTTNKDWISLIGGNEWNRITKLM